MKERNRAVVEFGWWEGTEHDEAIRDAVEAAMRLYMDRVCDLRGADADCSATLNAPGIKWSDPREGQEGADASGPT